MSILIDTRETKLLRIVKELGLESLVERKQLTLGDIQFLKGGKVAFIIERKTVRDLASSYKDGRLTNQIQRLQKCGIPANRVLYLIEGTWLGVRRMGLTREDLQMLMCDVMLGYDFHVYHVSNLGETVSFVKQIFLSLSNKPQIDGVEINRIKKHTVCDRQSILASQLYSIPGVSQKVALTISKHFESMRDLIKHLDNPEKFKEIIIPYKHPKPLDDKIINLLVNML